jgi:hypothetical protein
MPEQKRSATVMMEMALSSPQAIADLQTNPVETLKKLEAQVVQGFPRPDDKTASRLWLVVVVSFALVLVFCAWVLGTGVTAKLDAGATYAVKSDTVLTLFTTVVGFLAGLLAPSPVSKKDG